MGILGLLVARLRLRLARARMGSALLRTVDAMRAAALGIPRGLDPGRGTPVDHIIRLNCTYFNGRRERCQVIARWYAPFIITATRCAMPKSSKRGSAPGRIRAAGQRPGTFQPRHPKFGGRKKGTPNALSAEYKEAILEAAYRIGSDLNGKDGVVGYLRWLATQRTDAYTFLLQHAVLLEARGSSPFDAADFSAEELGKPVKQHIGLSDEDRRPVKSTLANPDGDPFAWTGQRLPVSALMDRAIRKPDEFCQLLASAFLASKSERRQRRAAERREWMRKRAQQSAKSGA